MQRQCDDFWITITTMSAEAAEAKKNELILECRYMALQQSSENKVKDSTARLEESMLENQTLTSALEIIKGIFGGRDPAEIMNEFDESKANLGVALRKIEELDSEVSTRSESIARLERKIAEMSSIDEVMKWEIDLLQKEKRILTQKLEQTETSYSTEHETRLKLDVEVLRLLAKVDILMEDGQKVTKQTNELTRMICERDELKKRLERATASLA